MIKKKSHIEYEWVLNVLKNSVYYQKLFLVVDIVIGVRLLLHGLKTFAFIHCVKHELNW